MLIFHMIVDLIKDTIRGYKVTANFDSDKISSVLKTS